MHPRGLGLGRLLEGVEACCRDEGEKCGTKVGL